MSRTPSTARVDPEGDVAPASRGARGRRPTINDVARLAGVSKKTVSRIINESPAVSVETRARVDAVIEQLGYSPDPHARGLAFRRSFTLGFIYDNPNPQYVVNAQQGILDAARGAGFELMVRPCDRGDAGFLSDMRRFVERQKFAGVVMLSSVSEDAGLAELLTELDVPYVRVASVALDRPDAMLVSHDGEGAFAVAEHLAALGHRSIGLITGPSSFRSARERRKGFEDGLVARGLRLRPGDAEEGEYTYDSGVASARRLLSRSDRPTAVFALNDEMAAGVYRAAHELGLRVPEDVSVVGFDDAPIATQVWPPLTTVILPVREMGRLAAERLIDAALGRRPAPWPRITPRLVVRDSTAAPSG